MILLLAMIKKEVKTHDKYSDYKLPPNAGLLFENQGPIKISTTKWTLVTYLDLTLYRNLEIKKNDMIVLGDTVCKNAVRGPVMIQCYTLKYGVLEQFNKIEENRHKLLKSFTYHLEGVGLFSLNDTCRAYSTRDILVPTRHAKRFSNHHFVPRTQFTHFSEINKIMNKNISVLTDYHNHRNQLQELDDVSIVLDEANNKINKKYNLLSLKQEHVTYNYALLLILGVIVTVMFIAIVVCKMTMQPTTTR